HVSSVSLVSDVSERPAASPLQASGATPRAGQQRTKALPGPPRECLLWDRRGDRDGQGRSWTDKTLLLGAARPPRPPMKVAAYPGQGRTKSTKVLAELAEKAEKNLKRNSRMWPGNPWRVGLQCAGRQSPAATSRASK